MLLLNLEVLRNQANLATVNRNMVAARSQPGYETKLAIVKRQLNSPPATPFVMVTGKGEIESMVRKTDSRLGVSDLQQLDGEYVLVLAQ
jgi:hypothetical protein